MRHNIHIYYNRITRLWQVRIHRPRSGWTIYRDAGSMAGAFEIAAFWHEHRDDYATGCEPCIT